MLVDIARSVGGYLHDLILGNIDLGILIGYIAQAMFAMRFVVQWIASERAGKSVVPTAGSARRRIAGRSGPAVIPDAVGGAMAGAASCWSA